MGRFFYVTTKGLMLIEVFGYNHVAPLGLKKENRFFYNHDDPSGLKIGCGGVWRGMAVFGVPRIIDLGGRGWYLYGVIHLRGMKSFFEILVFF